MYMRRKGLHLGLRTVPVMAEALEKWDKVCGQSAITSISHVLKLNGYGRRQTKVNGKRLRFRGGGGKL